MAETRNPFKPLGTRLRDFARGKISRYVPAGESSSGKTAGPSWASNASAPLDWGDQSPAAPQAGSADFSSFETHTERSVPASYLGASSNGQPATPAPQATADPAPQQKPMSRLDFLNFIWAKREEQLHGNRPAPPETPPADSGNVQRSADGEAATPKPIGRRRRGAVVDVPTPRSPETPTESGASDSSDSPDFFFVGEDSSPDAPIPPSVQAMRASGDDAPATPQVQRSSTPSEDLSDSGVSEASPWSSFTGAPTSSFNTSPAAPDVPARSVESNTPNPVAAQSVQTVSSQSAAGNPSVQRSVETSSAASTSGSTTETSGLLYMPADHVTRSEAPSSYSASPASPSIQRASAETSPTQFDDGFQSQPAPTNSSPAQSQPAAYSPTSTPNTAPSIQPARFTDAPVENYDAQPAYDIGSESASSTAGISAAPYTASIPSSASASTASSAPAQSPTPSVQLQRDSQPAPKSSKSRKSQSARQQPATSVELSTVYAPPSEPATAYTPAPSQSVQRDVDEFAAPSSMPDAPFVAQQAGAPASSVQRSSDPQVSNYGDLPDTAFNSSTPSSVTSTSQNSPTAAPQMSAQPVVTSSSQPSAGAVQRKQSSSAGTSSLTQAASPSQPANEAQAAPAEYAAESPTLLTPAPSFQHNVDNPVSTTPPTISRYADVPDAAFDTPSSAVNAPTPAYTAEASTQLETPSMQQTAGTATPSISRYADVPDAAFNAPSSAANIADTSTYVAPTTQSKPNGSIQRRRGGMGVSYTPGDSNAVQRDTDKNVTLSAAPASVWTPSAELAPPSPPTFAAPSPWETYMEAPEFSEPPNPAPPGKPVNAASPAAPASSPANPSTVQRSVDSASTGTTTPQFSPMPDSSFMTDAPQAESSYRGLPDSTFMSTPTQTPSSASSASQGNQPAAPSFSAQSPNITASSTVQRSTANAVSTPPPTISRYTEPDAASSAASDEGSLPVHNFDVFEALSGNYTDPPQYNSPASNSQPSFASPSSSSANAPSISRSTDTGASSSAPSQQFSHNFTPESSVPAPGSVEADMLQLLNLPSTTLVAGLKQAPATPEISRMPANSPSETQHFTNYSGSPASLPSSIFSSSSVSSTSQAAAPAPSSSETGTPVVQRALPEESAGGGESSQNQQAGSEDGAAEQDIDGLAREVYKMLRTKLRTEHERRNGH